MPNDRKNLPVTAGCGRQGFFLFRRRGVPPEEPRRLFTEVGVGCRLAEGDAPDTE